MELLLNKWRNFSLIGRTCDWSSHCHGSIPWGLPLYNMINIDAVVVIVFFNYLWKFLNVQKVGNHKRILINVFVFAVIILKNKKSLVKKSLFYLKLYFVRLKIECNMIVLILFKTDLEMLYEKNYFEFCRARINGNTHIFRKIKKYSL